MQKLNSCIFVFVVVVLVAVVGCSNPSERTEPAVGVAEATVVDEVERVTFFSNYPFSVLKTLNPAYLSGVDPSQWQYHTLAQADSRAGSYRFGGSMLREDVEGKVLYVWIPSLESFMRVHETWFDHFDEFIVDPEFYSGLRPLKGLQIRPNVRSMLFPGDLRTGGAIVLQLQGLRYVQSAGGYYFDAGVVSVDQLAKTSYDWVVVHRVNRSDALVIQADEQTMLRELSEGSLTNYFAYLRDNNPFRRMMDARGRVNINEMAGEAAEFLQNLSRRFSWLKETYELLPTATKSEVVETGSGLAARWVASHMTAEQLDRYVLDLDWETIADTSPDWWYQSREIGDHSQPRSEFEGRSNEDVAVQLWWQRRGQIIFETFHKALVNELRQR